MGTGSGLGRGRASHVQYAVVLTAAADPFGYHAHATRQIGRARALPELLHENIKPIRWAPEHIGPSTGNNPADDLLDPHPFLCQRQDNGVVVCIPKSSIMLAQLGEIAYAALEEIYTLAKILK